MRPKELLKLAKDFEKKAKRNTSLAEVVRAQEEAAEACQKAREAYESYVGSL